jgi:SAM-dependent methyltransferase
MNSREPKPHLLLAEAEFFFDPLPSKPFLSSTKGSPITRRYFFERLKFQLGLKKEFEFTTRVSELLGHGAVAGDGGDTSLTLRQKGHSKQGQPGYSHGVVRFPMFQCSFNVNPNVYVPRGIVAVVNLHVMKELSQLDLNGKTFWDLGCGSGITGIMVKKNFPQLHVICSDISAEALEVTRENAKLNGVDIEILKGSLLEDFADRKMDFLSFFSPQTPGSDWKKKTSYSEYYVPAVTEPTVAFEGGTHGTELLEKVCHQAKDRIRPGGKIFLIGARVPFVAVNLLSDTYIPKVAKGPPVDTMLWTFSLR